MVMMVMMAMSVVLLREAVSLEVAGSAGGEGVEVVGRLGGGVVGWLESDNVLGEELEVVLIGGVVLGAEVLLGSSDAELESSSVVEDAVVMVART